jgi:hypothetical protein
MGFLGHKAVHGEDQRRRAKPGRCEPGCEPLSKMESVGGSFFRLHFSLSLPLSYLFSFTIISFHQGQSIYSATLLVSCLHGPRTCIRLPSRHQLPSGMYLRGCWRSRRNGHCAHEVVLARITESHWQTGSVRGVAAWAAPTQTSRDAAAPSLTPSSMLL